MAVGDSVWKSAHVGTIALDSGNPATIVLTHAVTANIQAVVTEKDFNHFCTGHTVEQFAFDEANIKRSAFSTFWPVGTNVLALAGAVLGTLHTEIEEALRFGSSVNLNNHKYQGVKYAVTLTMTPGHSVDADGYCDSGTARLEQFYPLSGDGIEKESQADLRRIKQLLGR